MHDFFLKLSKIFQSNKFTYILKVAFERTDKYLKSRTVLVQEVVYNLAVSHFLNRGFLVYFVLPLIIFKLYLHFSFVFLSNLLFFLLLLESCQPRGLLLRLFHFPFVLN